MDIEKILVKLDGKEYSFSVEIMHDEDETIYRVTPDQGERVLDDVSPGYLEFDENGRLQVDERVENAQVKAVAAEIWKAIKQQMLITSKD